MRAPASAAITARATLPYRRSPAVRPVSVPSIDLRDNPTNTGGPSAASSPRRRSSARLCSRVLPKPNRSEEHTSELQSQSNIVCRLLLEKKKKQREHVLH